MSQTEDTFSENSIDKISKTPITKIVIISKDNKNKLDLLKRKFIELKNWNPDYKTDFTYSVFIADKTYLTIMNSVQNRTGKQIEEWAKNGKIN